MKEIDANKQAWSLLTKEHYETFLKAYKNNTYSIRKEILSELGDIKGKKIIHLQCNTGADSIYLAKMGAEVTGVDLVPENIEAAKSLAKELGVQNVRFIASDIMELMENHHEKYDIVFTSEGVLVWLPDKKKWADTIAALLKQDGFLYVCDSHPYFLTFNEEAFANGELKVGYPYFKTTPDKEDSIGGYAAESKKAENYSWMYTVGSIINNLISAGLKIEYFNEHDWNPCDMGNMVFENGNYYSKYFKGQIPLMFSLKATVSA